MEVATYNVNERLAKTIIKCDCEAHTALGVSIRNDSTVIDVSQCEGILHRLHFREDGVLIETAIGQ